MYFFSGYLDNLLILGQETFSPTDIKRLFFSLRTTPYVFFTTATSFTTPATFHYFPLPYIK